MNSAYDQTKSILKKYNISANKSLGQNFLINDEIIDTIIESANVQNSDLIIEIGPGLGILTEKLLQKAGKVIAIELDKRMLNILNDRFSIFNNFEIINEDILKVDLNSIISKKDDNLTNVKIVANLPYYITTPIIMKLLEDKLNIETITIMVQKEVADRICATPGDRLSGAITYSVNYYCDTKSIITVPNSSFIPEPEVQSEVIQLTLKKENKLKINNEELFFKFIKASFTQRRKTLVNAISNNGLMSKQEIINLLKKEGIDEKIRGENLSMQDFANLINNI